MIQKDSEVGVLTAFLLVKHFDILIFCLEKMGVNRGEKNWIQIALCNPDYWILNWILYPVENLTTHNTTNVGPHVGHDVMMAYYQWTVP